MPRVYKITTSKAKTSSKDMKDALHLVQKGKSIRETAITSKKFFCMMKIQDLPRIIMLKEYLQTSRN